MNYVLFQKRKSSLPMPPFWACLLLLTHLYTIPRFWRGIFMFKLAEISHQQSWCWSWLSMETFLLEIKAEIGWLVVQMSVCRAERGTIDCTVWDLNFLLQISIFSKNVSDTSDFYFFLLDLEHSQTTKANVEVMSLLFIGCEHELASRRICLFQKRMLLLVL